MLHIHQRFVTVCISIVCISWFAASCSVTPNSGNPTTAANPTQTDSAPILAQDTIQIDAQGTPKPFNSRLLGTNLPAWLTPSRLENEAFRQRIAQSGATVIRMPGGSWSNGYDWLSCETSNQQQGSSECYWPWAARPTDFMNVLRATNKAGMWTVSINGTAKEAAALVAFFNGDVKDTRPIGVDIRGKDWHTVGYWARLRSQHGNSEPRKILLWEVGNEIYGGKQGAKCGANGWEDVWTCDGTAYARGDDQHDGYLAFREEMRKIDPTILVGAVGIAQQNEWNNWGNDVIAASGKKMDFYIIHQYAYGSPHADLNDVLNQPQATWQELVAGVNQAFDRYAEGHRVPIAITEYNLFAFQDLDNERLMTRAVNTLFLADTIGQMAEQGVMLANQYDMANGAADNGTDYGLINADTYARNPQYYVYPLWTRFGSQMLPARSTFDAVTTLSVYAGRVDDTSITLMAINKTSKAISATIHVNGVLQISAVSTDVVQAASLDATSVSLNGQNNPPDDLSNMPTVSLTDVANPLNYTFAPYSMTLLRFTSAAPRSGSLTATRTLK